MTNREANFQESADPNKTDYRTRLLFAPAGAGPALGQDELPLVLLGSSVSQARPGCVLSWSCLWMGGALDESLMPSDSSTIWRGGLSRRNWKFELYDTALPPLAAALPTCRINVLLQIEMVIGTERNADADSGWKDFFTTEGLVWSLLPKKMSMVYVRRPDGLFWVEPKRALHRPLGTWT